MPVELSTIDALLFTYAGAMLINAISSFALWIQEQTSIRRNLLLVWLTSMFAFVGHGLAGSNELVMALAFLPIFLVGTSLASVVAEVLDFEVPYRPLGVGIVVGGMASVALWAVGAPFAAYCMATVLAAGMPLLWVLQRTFRTGRWSSLTLAGRGLVISAALWVTHLLNAPFLRNRPEYDELGFMVAVLTIFNLSIFAPAAIIERATASRARAETQLELARHLQMSLLPKMHRISGLELVTYIQSAEGMAGDYFDLQTFGNRSWLLLGDVNGHGLSSGLVMLMSQSILSAVLEANPGISPAELAYVGNSVLYRNLLRLNDHRAMTLVAIARDADTGRYTMCGSSERVFIVRNTGGVEVLDADQMPHTMGLLDEFPLDTYQEVEFELLEGDLLMLTTDGVTEAPCRGDYALGMYGEMRLIDFLERHRGAPLSTIRDELMVELTAFTGGAFPDDVSYLFARATGTGTPAVSRDTSRTGPTGRAPGT